MNVSLTEELEKLVQRRLDSGLYSTASEVVREALRLLADQDKLREMRLDELRKEIAKGLASAEAGRLVDGEEAMAKILGKLREGELAPK